MISFLHRLVECLGDRLLPYLPSALSALLPLTADASTVSDVCALLSQLAIRYKAALAPLLAEVSCKFICGVSSQECIGRLLGHGRLSNLGAAGKMV